MDIWRGFRPAGRVPFWITRKEPSSDWGYVSGERLAKRGRSQSPHPQTPIYGSVSLRVYVCFRRAKSRSVSILLSAHWGLLLLKFVRPSALMYTAWFVPTCLVRQWSGTRQLPSRHSYTALGGVISTVFLLNFCFVGPSGPWQEGRKVLFSEPPDASVFLPGGRPPVKRGSGGNDCEHRRRQGAHRKRPPAILKVNCPKGAREGGLGHWLLSDRPESNTVSSPPRRAEASQ